MSNITETAVDNDTVFLGNKIETKETVTGTVAGTQGTVTDTTTYPVATQATKTEKVTIDGGTEQTVTFTTAINKGTVTSSNAFPLGSQATKTEKVTIDGGDEQTVTFVGAVTDAVDIAAEMDSQLYGCSVAVVGTDIVITSDQTGASSSVAIGTGTSDLTWDAAVVTNDEEGIAKQLNAQLTGCSAYTSGGQVVIESDTAGTTSTVAIGTGTATLTWDAAVDGTGVAGPLTITKGTLMARNTSTGKMVPFVASGGNGTGTPTGVIDTTNSYTVTGDKQLNIGRSGSVDAGLLLVQATGAAPTSLQIDELEKNSSIVAISVADTGR